MSIREITTMILGVFGTYVLFLGATSTQSGTIQGLGSLFAAWIHFLVILVALPFLLLATYKSEIISSWFFYSILGLSILNSILMILISIGIPSVRSLFLSSALLELIPVIILYQNSDKRA